MAEDILSCRADFADAFGALCLKDAAQRKNCRPLGQVLLAARPQGYLFERNKCLYYAVRRADKGGRFFLAKKSPALTLLALKLPRGKYERGDLSK